MRGAVEALVPKGPGPLDLYFHACLRILRRQEAGRDRNFVIYDADDQLTVVKECLKEPNV